MRWVTVKIVYGLPEAHIVKGVLESEGIPVRLEYEAVGKIYSLTVDGLARVYVQVPEDAVEDALERLQEAEELGEEERDEVDWGRPED